MNVLAFSIQTVPDVEGGRQLYGLSELKDADVAKAMFHQRSQKTGGSERLGHHLQKVVSISIVRRSTRGLKIESLGKADASERELLTRFFGLIEKHIPTLVSWNGTAVDLPILNYRALLQGVDARSFWEKGRSDKSFETDNYFTASHWRHIDVMDVLSGFQPEACAPLNEVASLLGFPGQLEMSDTEVWAHDLAGDKAKVRGYAVIGALNTYLVYLRLQLIRGQLSSNHYADECGVIRETLLAANKPYFIKFLDAWDHLD